MKFPVMKFPVPPWARLRGARRTGTNGPQPVPARSGSEARRANRSADHFGTGVELPLFLNRERRRYPIRLDRRG
jgi:hypothetical protein